MRQKSQTRQTDTAKSIKDIRQRIVDLALDVPELSPRELAVRFTGTENYFVSEASVYRLLKSLNLIISPAFIVIKAANEFKDKTTAINQLKKIQRHQTQQKIYRSKINCCY